MNDTNAPPCDNSAGRVGSYCHQGRSWVGTSSLRLRPTNIAALICDGGFVCVRVNYTRAEQIHNKSKRWTLSLSTLRRAPRFQRDMQLMR